ncbi:MAG: hypothetical protein QOI06_909 [Nocardioidaceae bacterium]|nr:hypothetical protein [Nocardioidaceae bacterium]
MTEAPDATGSEPVTENAPPPAIQERFRAALPNATRWLPGSRLRSPSEAMREAADEAAQLDDPDEWDRYATRGPVDALEARVAALLGKPAAAMFPSGIMAQQSVLRVWTDRQACKRIAVPALSHLLSHELDGPQLLNGFQYERLTTGPAVPTVADLEAIPGRLGAVLLELPLRDAGYLLPSWQQLGEFSAAARKRGVPVHFDGARLWESQPHLGHSLEEIAALADSVYVSFYKGLGGFAGAVVAGHDDVVDEARRWRTRHGGTLFSMLPYALAGLRGLRLLLPRMGEFHRRAIELAAALESRGVRVLPQPPHTNAYRVYFEQPADAVNERILTTLERDRVALLQPVQPGEMPGTSWTELTVGAATMEWAVDEAADALSGLLG